MSDRATIRWCKTHGEPAVLVEAGEWFCHSSRIRNTCDIVTMVEVGDGPLYRVGDSYEAIVNAMNAERDGYLTPVEVPE